MAFYPLTYATNATSIELSVTNPKNKAQTVVIKNPKYITGLTHNIVADGIANKLTLSLTHFIDPLRDESEYPKDIFGQIESDPSYIMVLLNNGLQEIKIRYGYAQGTEELAESMTEWFTMFIVGVGVKYRLSSVLYTITAVSSIVSSNLQTYTYNWRVMEETDENAASVTSFDRERMKTIIQKCIIDPPSETEPVKGLNCPVTYWNDVTPILPGSVFTQSSEGTLIQSNIDNVNFVKGCLTKCMGIAKGGYLTLPDGNGRMVTKYYDAVYTSFTISFRDTGSGTVAEVCPLQKAYVEGFDRVHMYFERFVQFESVQTKIGSSLGYLVYNGAAAVEGRQDFRASIAENDLYTSAEVIDLDLDFPIIVGLYTKNKLQPIDPDGNTYEQEQVSMELSVKNGDPALSNTMSSLTSISDFNTVAGKLIANGTVTIPGTARVLGMLSMFQLYVYVSNKLAVTSGNYRILSQTDTISGGVYTTTIDVYKEGSLSGEAVYGA